MYFKRWTGQILKTNNQSISKSTKKKEKDKNLIQKVRRLNIRINFALCCEEILMYYKQKTSKSFSLQKNIDNLKQDFISRSIDNLYERIDDNLKDTLAHDILDAYYKTLYIIRSETGNDSDIQNISPDIFEEYYDKIIAIKTPFKEKIIQETSNNNYPQQSITSLFGSVLKKTEDLIYQASIKAKIEAYKHENIAEYTYCASDSDSSCDDCKQNDGKIFSVNDASGEENLPPIHPNCRCNVLVVYPDGTVEEDQTIIEEFCEWMGNFFLDTSRWQWPWPSNRDKDYKLEHTLIEVGEKTYNLNTKLTQNIAILPNGDIINEDKLTENDKELLNLMKLRDSTTDYQEKESYILEGIKLLENEESQYIDFFKPYDFYTLTEDVTDRLNEFMAKVIEDNKDLIEEGNFSQKISEYYNSVKAGAKYDLKSQPEWQQSMYIYDGEIVDQDALGNINYGYFGQALFRDEMLLGFGAGVAQMIAGTSSITYFNSYFDDFRDQVRIIQGIDIYNADNENE